MKWLLSFVIVLGIAFAIMFILGSRFPRDHVATVRARYQAAPAAIWALISNPSLAASWRSDVKSVDTLPPVGGLPAWREHSRQGITTYVMAEQHAMTSQVSRITDDALPYGGQWEFTLVPSGSGSELTITERGVVKPPLFRFLARTVFGFTSSLEEYHRSLAGKLNEQVTIEIVAAGR